MTCTLDVFSWRSKEVAAVWCDQALVYLSIGEEAKTRAGDWCRALGLTASQPGSLKAKSRLLKSLERYAAGSSRPFDTVPTALVGGTPFQRDVWQALAKIEPGSLWTYGDVARFVKRPRAVRAVGQAVGKNPLTIVLPCHRVIGTGNALTGFGCGLPIKKELLILEGWEIDAERDRVRGRR